MLQATRLTSWNSSTSRLDASVEFYRDLLGATVVSGPSVERRSDGSEVTIARLQIGELDLGIFQWPDGRRPQWDHHTFEVEWPGDAAAVREMLESQGVTVENVRAHSEDAGYSIVLRDPAGERVEFFTSGPNL
jgi:catechol 2,3-dioxygenase-like lactoylglutathione lyase family enzyme